MKINKESGLEVTMVILMLCIFFTYSFHEKYRFFNILAYSIGFFSFVVEAILYKFNKKIYIFIFILFILAGINYFVIGDSGVGAPFKVVFQYSPIAIFLIKAKKPNKIIWYGVACVIALFTEIAWIHSPDNYTVWKGISRNYISIFLLFSLFIVTVIREKKSKKKLPIWIPISFLTLTILAEGRGGIISGFIYLLMVICIDIFNDPLVKRRKMKLIVLILLSVLGLSLFFIYNDSIMNKLTSRFITGDITNSNNGRMRIYTMYLSNAFLSVKNFVFGVGSSLISSSLNFEIGSNLHSSYLQIHSSLGILGLLGFFMLTFSSIKYLIRHKKYQSFCVLVVFLIRILTDYAAYGFITDILLLYYFYQPMIIGRQYE